MKTNKAQEELREYQKFYKKIYRRLSRKQEAQSKKLALDENQVLLPAREALASLNTGGKLLRGMLVVLGFKIALDAWEKKAAKNLDVPDIQKVKTDYSYADSLALAFETFQTGILIHDDIIDRAALRRGKKTVHLRYKERVEKEGIRMVTENDDPAHLSASVALCVGDYALHEAVRVISKNYGSCDNLGSLITYYLDTALETCRGELLDVMLPYEMQTLPEAEADTLLEKSVDEIYRLKTARYSLAGPLHLGMLLGEASPRQMQSLDALAEQVGIAYQIMDDVLGIYADEKDLGKDVGSDISEFKQTILYMYVKTRKPEYLPELLCHYGKTATPADLEAVQEIFRESGALDYAKEAMESRFTRALLAIDSIRWMTAEDKTILRGFIGYCRERKY